MRTFGERLRVAIEQHQRLTPAQFCDRSGFPLPLLSNYLNGTWKPGLESIVTIIEALPGTNIGWLLTGTPISN
jgi:predicted transcriptional regulator